PESHRFPYTTLFRSRRRAMSDAIVAKRYADALFQLAKDKNKLETIREELKIVRDVFVQNPKLQEVLFHPRIKHQDKVALIEDALDRKSTRLNSSHVS